MTTNPLLEEIWATKDRLDAEAGGDIHVFCEQVRAWSAAHPQVGIKVRTATELQAWMANLEQEETLVLREDPSEYGTKKDEN
jgi:hypothetical protein